jgi:hypothetical protein
MNLDALPFTLFILMVELSIGSLILLVILDFRNDVTRGFVKTMAGMALIALGLTLWIGVSLSQESDVDGFRVDDAFYDPTNYALATTMVACGLYTAALLLGQRRTSLFFGVASGAGGLTTIGLLAALIAPPTWGYLAALLSLLAGTGALGAVTISMVWGHWYLTSSRLPAKPLQELAIVLLLFLAVQVVVMVINMAVPVRIVPTPANPLTLPLAEAPAFWLRVGVGLVFPVILGAMALQTAREQAMQSATGLLYIAMGAVFAGEVLARGLMFLTAKPI